MKKEKELDKRMFKKSLEELEQYLHFKKRGFAIDNKKGKGNANKNLKRKGHETNSKNNSLEYIQASHPLIN